MSVPVGQRVRVNDDVFEGSEDPREIGIRGAYGTIVWASPVRDNARTDLYEVEIDGEEWPVLEDEFVLVKGEDA